VTSIAGTGPVAITLSGMDRESSWLQRLVERFIGPQAPGDGPRAPAVGSAAPGTGATAPRGDRPVAVPPAGAPTIAADTPDAAIGAEVPALMAYLLGGFRVLIDGRPVTEWGSGRARKLFQYLLAHHERPVPRDVLMEVFWPEAEPDRASNSLHVALSALRRGLAPWSTRPVVTHQDGLYRLNPELSIWLDVDAFERHLADARRLEAGGDLDAAEAQYELAAEICQGPFLADDPYEEWAGPPRERFGLMHLDGLDRLSQIHFSRGRYAACVAAGRRILAIDACHEATHQRAMRCYSRMGQVHLALRQYQACAEALARELETGPDAATVALYERVRGHGAV